MKYVNVILRRIEITALHPRGIVGLIIHLLSFAPQRKSNSLLFLLSASLSLGMTVSICDGVFVDDMFGSVLYC